MTHRTRWLFPALLCSAPVWAQPFSTLDTRSMSMGDTGVASASLGAAGLFNPALLVPREDDDTLHIVFPNIGVAVYADGDAMDAYQDIEDDAYLDEIDTAIEGMENASNDAEFVEYKDQFMHNAYQLENNLEKLSEQPFRINAGAYGSASFPVGRTGLSVIASATATIETAPIISDCDDQLLDDYLAFFEPVNSQADLALQAANPVANQAGCNNTAIVEIPSGDINDPSDEMTSEVIVAGVTLTELGIAMGREFQLFGTRMSLGITPKLQTVTSYYAVPTVQELDDDNYDLADDLEDSEKEESDFNIDVGMAMHFLEDDALTLGLTIKNLIANSYETSVSSTTGRAAAFDVDTLVRMGVAWEAPAGLTFAADLDLTKNEPYFLGEDTQFFGAGVEWNVADVVRLRGGYRTNLADADDQAITAGIGFNIIAVYVDLGAQVSENNLGGAMQLGVAF